MNIQTISLFAASVVGFFGGCLWINGQQSLEINRLNSQLKVKQEEVSKANQTVENHKQFIRKKDQTVNEFCRKYGAK